MLNEGVGEEWDCVAVSVSTGVGNGKAKVEESNAKVMVSSARLPVVKRMICMTRDQTTCV
jgi:hypothetical protein